MTAAAPTRPHSSALASALWTTPSTTGEALKLLVLAVAGSLILTLSAKTQVPFWPVPMTLQTGAVVLLALGLGARAALAAVILYLVEGALGLPVFAGTPAQGLGLAYMMGPTGGYLAGFLIAALVVGWLADRGASRALLPALAVSLLGIALMFATGLAWLAHLIGPQKAIALGLYPFVLGDLVKAALAALIVRAGWLAVQR